MFDSGFNYEKQSVNSDVSMNTDMKVFNGAISLLKHSYNKSKVSQSNHKLPNFNVCKKLNMKHVMAKLNGNPQLSDLYDEEPLSFRPSEVNGNVNVGIKDDIIQSEEEIIDIEQANNIFWKIKEKQIANDDELTSQDYTKLSKMVHTNTSSHISCIVSKIDKDGAILVTAEDQIFTIPTCFLPNFTAPGNSYNITIQETCKASERDNVMKELQKKLKEKK
jgi:hypothetical protein